MSDGASPVGNPTATGLIKTTFNLSQRGARALDYLLRRLRKDDKTATMNSTLCAMAEMVKELCPEDEDESFTALKIQVTDKAGEVHTFLFL